MTQPELVHEEYLDISEAYRYDDSVKKISEIEKEPPNSINYNQVGDISITIDPSSNWLLPSKSYLYIEGRILQAQGNEFLPITKHNKAYPDLALGNNAMMYLFSNAKYSLNDYEIENFNYPGYTTTMHGLISTSKSFNGLDQCWALDEYDGQTVPSVNYSALAAFTDADMPAAGANPTAAEYRAIMKLLIPRFNTTNALTGNNAIPNVNNEDLLCAAANPTAAEILTGCNAVFNLIDHDTPAIIKYLVQEDIPDSSIGSLRGAVNRMVTRLNENLVNEQPGLQYNKGYLRRLEIACNPFETVQPVENAGLFSFRIPLSLIFNFCDQYRKVIFNCKHSISFTRSPTSHEALFKDRKMQTGDVQIKTMRWYMPVIQPNPNYEKSLLTMIASNIEVPLAFMTKKIEVVTLVPGNTVQSIQLTYSGGVEKPRYIVVGFQAYNIHDPAFLYPSEQDFNHAIFNDVTNLDGMIDVNQVSLYINGESYSINNYFNSFSDNRGARWYNEFKKFREYYMGSDANDGGISYNDFINLYRLYVFDISKQSEIVTGGVSNVRLEFKFGRAPSGNSRNNAYCVSYYDRLWSLRSDGTKQYLVR